MTLEEQLTAARGRLAAVQTEIESHLSRGFADQSSSSVLASLRIKQVETERLIAILNDLDLSAGYQRGRADCAGNLRQEFGLDRPDNTPILNLLRRLANRWEGFSA